MHRNTRAFTLVELLVTIGIIALLVGLVVVSMKGLRLAGHRTESLGALRQMTTGYLAYAADHNQRLMPGYIAPQDFQSGGAFAGLDNRIVLPNEYRFDLSAAFDREDAGSYVWRLAPYVDGRWETFCADYGSQGLLSRFQAEIDGSNLASLDGDEVYGRGSRDPASDVGIGIFPSFGLNSIYLGGDSFHGGSSIAAMNPWSPADPQMVVGASRMSQVKAPSKVIVFAASRQANENLLPPADAGGSREIVYGYPELRPPLVAIDVNDPAASNWPASEKQWQYAAGSLEPEPLGDFDAGGGLPVSRWGQDKVPTAMLDGSTEIQNPRDMAVDITRWHWNYTLVVTEGANP